MELEKKKLIQDMYPNIDAKTFDKLVYFVEQTNLDPLRNQIYVVSRNSKTPDGKWEKSFTIQTSIDGFRLIAERTGKYAPGKEPLIILDEDKNIVSSTAYVKKMTEDKTWHEVASTAYYEEYAQTDKEGKPTRFWKQMPKLMLSKCAEALALRKAFPDALSGIYTDDEMDQAKETVEEEVKKETISSTIQVNGKISKDQMILLSKELEKEEDLLENILNGYKITKLADLKAENFEGIMKRIKEIKEGRPF